MKEIRITRSRNNSLPRKTSYPWVHTLPNTNIGSIDIYNIRTKLYDAYLGSDIRTKRTLLKILPGTNKNPDIFPPCLFNLKGNCIYPTLYQNVKNFQTINPSNVSPYLLNNSNIFTIAGSDK